MSAATKSKAKGGKFEREIAKSLSIWLFNDPHILKREPTSGAQKVQHYVGDVVPVAPIRWSSFPFLIEGKNGYKDNIPTFNNQKMLRQWLTKLLSERTEQQCICWLIVRYHGRAPLIITDTPFNFYSPLTINIQDSGNTIPFHVYEMRDLLKYNFYELYKDNYLLMEIFE
jgi:hypothetical protein